MSIEWGPATKAAAERQAAAIREVAHVSGIIEPLAADSHHWNCEAAHGAFARPQPVADLRYGEQAGHSCDPSPVTSSFAILVGT